MMDDKYYDELREMASKQEDDIKVVKEEFDIM
jgi:hypothetical protein